MWFESWESVGRVLATGTASYVLLVVLLRVSGKRTLSKLNAFDLVVTIAMGSTLASVLMSKSSPVADGLAAFLVLVVCQYVIAKVSVHVHWFAWLVRSRPRLVVSGGRILDAALQEERVTRGELLAALRQAGCARLSEAGAVVLETDGSFSVLRDEPQPGDGTLEDVRR